MKFYLIHFILTCQRLNYFQPVGYYIQNSWNEQFLAVFLNTGSFFYIKKFIRLWNYISTPPWATAKIFIGLSFKGYLFLMMCSSIMSFTKFEHLEYTSAQLYPFQHLYSRTLLCYLSAICFQVINGFPSSTPPPFYLKILVKVVGIFSRYFAWLLMLSNVATVRPRSETYMQSKCKGCFSKCTPIFFACVTPILVKTPGCCPQIIPLMLSQVYP